MWMSGLLNRATAWRKRALASGVAAQRIEASVSSGSSTNTARGSQMLPRDSVVRGTRPATPQSSAEDSFSAMTRNSGDTAGQRAVQTDDSEEDSRRRNPGATRRYDPLCSSDVPSASWPGRACEDAPEDEGDVVETVEFQSDDSSDEDTVGEGGGDVAPDISPMEMRESPGIRTHYRALVPN